MDRLKRALIDFEGTENENLHSNMDRLKRRHDRSGNKAANHLHSNMDRLKRTEHIYNGQNDIIYIPIWID